MSGPVNSPHPLRPERYSPTDLVRYETCPLQYFYSKHWELRDVWAQPRPALFFGTLVHDVLRDLFRGGGPHHMSWKEVRDLYRERWKDLNVESIGFSNRQQAVDDYHDGRHVLRWFYKRYLEEESPDIEYLRVEDPLQVEVDRHTLSGRLDRLDRFRDGTLRIVDYKTSRSAATETEVAGDLQLQLYSLMVEKKYGPAAIVIEQVQLRHQSIVQVPAPDPDEVLGRLRTLIRGIEEQRFVATLHQWCGYCDFQYICPTHLSQHPAGMVAPDILDKVEASLLELPLWTPLLVARGLLEHRALGLKEAITSFTRAVAANPYDPTGYFLRGRALYQHKKLRLAHEDLSRAVELGLHDVEDPNPGLEATYYLGQTYAARREWQSAVDQLTRFIDGFRRERQGPGAASLRVNPDLVIEAQIARAEAWRQLDQRDRATEALEDLVATVPDNSRALRALARTYLDGNEPGQAEELFLELVETGARETMDFLLGGDVAQALGNWDTAVDRYSRAAALDPLDREAWASLAGLAYATEQYELAGEAYLNVLEIEGVSFGEEDQVRIAPGLSGYCRDLLVCQLRTQQNDAAKQTFDRLMESLLERGDLREALNACNTWLAYRPGASPVLLEKTELALELDVDDEAIEAYVQIARHLRRDGCLNEARYMLSRALQLDPEAPAARRELAALERARRGESIARTGDPGRLPEGEPLGKPLFSGQAIAVIGGDKVGSEYVPKLSELGAEGTWISADTNPAYIRDKIQSMDGICVVTSEIGHALSGEAVRQAKLLGIPFIAPTRIRGAKRVVDTIAAELAPAVLGRRTAP